ncbi:IS4 family transposase [Oscillibacter sp.]|uniref:IS4 family transposase n=2 Tax=unclassified Oscillibacter TaxID=2629304 RepID=UPI00289682C3|nr:IS4 family transposase [Oscillibacter sp.]
MTSAYTINAALNYAIRTAVAQCGKSRNFSRKSSLTRETIIRLLVGAEGGSLDKILHTAGIKVTASAVSQRRAQINPAVFRAAFTSFNSDCTDNASFHGYRVLSVDGTTVNLPRNPASPSFVCNDGIPKGVNQLHATPLYDILSRTFTDIVIQPESKKNEIGALITMLQRNAFDRKTLIVADRGFESYNLTAHLLEKPNTDFLIRVKQSHSAMREVAKLPMLELDCDILFSICTTQKKTDKENQNYVFLQVPKKSKPGSTTRRGRWDFGNYYPMRFRICRFQIDSGEFETVATSLPRSFSLEDIKTLYHLRWGIETSFRDLKYTLGLVNLHGKSDSFAEQEIYSSLTAFNFASRVCREVVVRQPTEGIYAYKVNFKMAVALCKEYIRTPKADSDKLMENIARYTVPIRPGRQDQRDLRVKGFPGFVYRVAA